MHDKQVYQTLVNEELRTSCILYSQETEVGGGGGDPNPVVTGMIEWVQKLKPPKIPRASNKTPKNLWTQNSPPKTPRRFFSSLKNFQKAN